MNDIRVVSAASPPTLAHKTRKDGAPSVMVAQASVVRSVGQPPSPRTSFKGWATRPNLRRADDKATADADPML